MILRFVVRERTAAVVEGGEGDMWVRGMSMDRAWRIAFWVILVLAAAASAARALIG